MGRIGKLQAVRAVAAANGQIKISILITCYRVIGSNGDLTDYGGDLVWKKALRIFGIRRNVSCANTTKSTGNLFLRF
ncbi:hypothetical protein BV912_05010 [Neisseria dumasiana]|uniref:Methylated-DNA-[protein]-cysteine S-methyltransferase DNA binding domain-containing protein n=1 Tax=Neisseria dumasiana TaxID=1931275 RepID=A0A1X3DK94_9NEIS|nr:hypothetical protein BV912_05010 [Neisseria dumasiana]